MAEHSPSKCGRCSLGMDAGRICKTAVTLTNYEGIQETFYRVFYGHTA